MAINETLIPIPGRLHSVATEGHVAGANEIYDDNTGETLDQLSVKPASTGTTGDYPYNGMGKIFLKKNMVNGVCTLTQAMMSAQNTIYVIKYDFTLAENITIPNSCILEFDGGSVNGAYTINGNNTGIVAPLVNIFNTNVVFSGNWNVVEVYPEWFGAKGDATTDDTSALSAAVNFCEGVTVKLSPKVYRASGVNITKDYVKILGSGRDSGCMILSVSQNEFILKCSGLRDTIQGIQISGSRGGNDEYGIILHGAQCEAVDCLVQSCGGLGIYVDYNANGNHNKNIRNCKVFTCKYSGIYVEASDSYVTNCEIANNEGDAQVVMGGSNLRIENCHIWSGDQITENVNTHGIYVTNSDMFRIVNCVLDMNCKNAIHIYPNSVNVLNEGAIINNTFFHNCKPSYNFDIYITPEENKVKSIVIANNMFRNSGNNEYKAQYNIVSEGACKATIMGNLYDDTTLSGRHLVNQSTCFISENTH